jgi:tetratricopeptide (TPR) repeat protein
MKILISILLVAIIPYLAFSQSNVIEEISSLLSEETILEAEKKVNEYIETDSNNVDAIMMKGNVIYNKFLYSQPSVMLAANNNESIYDATIGFLGENPQILLRNVAEEIINLWEKAVSIDMSRVDIHLGICHVMSTSLMTDELLEYLPVLIDNMDYQEGDEYNLCDYARNIIQREHFEDGISVYYKIAELFPEKRDLYSDIAAEYLVDGNFPEAYKNIEIALDSQADELTLGNGFFIKSIYGKYDEALDLFTKMSKMQNHKDYLLYGALLSMLNGEEYKKDLKVYIKSKAAHEKGIQLAKYMMSNDFDQSIASYDSLINFEFNDAFKIIMHQHFSNKYPDKFSPLFNLAEAYTYNSYFENAILTYESIDTTNLDITEKDLYNFYYAFALNEANQMEKSMLYWIPLLESKDFYFKSAAAYFIGKYHEENNNIQKAQEYFSLVSDKTSDSKYATFCWNKVK